MLRIFYVSLGREFTLIYKFKVMKKLILQHIAIIVVLVLPCLYAAPAQAEDFSDNKNLYGTWIMDSFQFDGENAHGRKEVGYTQIKYYGRDGEYACVEFYLKKDENGNFYMDIYPHEYGAPGQGFRLRGDMYTEMGREPLKDALRFVDSNTMKGRWGTRTDTWKRITLPKALQEHIVTTARIHQEATSQKYQQMLINNLMK